MQGAEKREAAAAAAPVLLPTAHLVEGGTTGKARWPRSHTSHMDTRSARMAPAATPPHPSEELRTVLSSFLNMSLQRRYQLL